MTPAEEDALKPVEWVHPLYLDGGALGIECSPVQLGRSQVPLFTLDTIRSAVAAERERCAKKAEWIFQHHFGATDGTAVRLAAAIREGEK